MTKIVENKTKTYTLIDVNPEALIALVALAQNTMGAGSSYRKAFAELADDITNALSSSEYNKADRLSQRIFESSNEHYGKSFAIDFRHFSSR